MNTPINTKRSGYKIYSKKNSYNSPSGCKFQKSNSPKIALTLFTSRTLKMILKVYFWNMETVWQTWMDSVWKISPIAIHLRHLSDPHFCTLVCVITQCDALQNYRFYKNENGKCYNNNTFHQSVCRRKIKHTYENSQ